MASSSPSPALSDTASVSSRRAPMHPPVARTVAPSEPQVHLDTDVSAGTSSGANGHSRKDKVWESRAAKKAAAAWASSAEKALTNDPKFRKYSQLVDRSLQTFDNVNEWADFISFLSRLLKTFQTYPQFNVIPRKLIVAKRLSQCLNPALPSGVHQRALDVYAHILGVIGPDGLRRDLQVWSPGLFPFFQFSGTSVKPHLLALYEKYYLPLQDDLRPVMKALLLALLPGLEEETGEYFDKVMSLLDFLSGTVSHAFFLQNIWLVMITTPSARQTALNYLVRRMPKLNSDERLTDFVGEDVGLMVRAFTATLEDEQLLVRRAMLDLLCSSFRIDSAAFKRSTRQEDKILLVHAALNVVLRRDLSLNRRLWSWLLGPDGDEDVQDAYLNEHGLDLVCATLKQDMLVPPGLDPAARQRPYRIFISLLDKWEIGQPLTNALLLDVFNSLQAGMANEKAKEEIATTASMVFESIDPFAMFRQFYFAILKDLGDESLGQKKNLELLRFVMRTFKMHDEETKRIHLPIIFAMLLQKLDADSSQRLRSAPAQAREAVQVALDLLSAIPKSLFESEPSRRASADVSSIADPSSSTTKDFLATARAFYESADAKVASDEGRRFRGFRSQEMALFGCATRLCEIGAAWATLEPRDEAKEEKLGMFLASLDLVGGLTGAMESKERDGFAWEHAEWLEAILARLKETSIFSEVDKILMTLVKAAKSEAFSPVLDIAAPQTTTSILGKLLHFLRPEFSPYHIRVVQLLWTLQDSWPSPVLEDLLTERLTSTDRSTRLEAFDLFGTLWRLTDDSQIPGGVFRKPMFVVLDTLRDRDADLGTRQAGETWMRCNLKSYVRILDPILLTLVDLKASRRPSKVSLEGIEVVGYMYDEPYDQSQAVYVLETLLNLAKFGGAGFAKAAKANLPKKSHHKHLLRRLEQDKYSMELSYLDIMMDVAIRYLQSEPQAADSQVMRRQNSLIQATVADLLQVLVSRGEVEHVRLKDLEIALAEKVLACVHAADLDLQNKLLHVLHTVIHGITTGAGRELTLRRRPDIDDLTKDEETSLLLSAQQANATPLFVGMVIAGLSRPSNRPILQFWVDFVLMTVPYYRRALHQLIIPLADCLCIMLKDSLRDVQVTYLAADAEAGTNKVTGVAAADFIMLVNALERIVLLALSEKPVSLAEEEETEKSEGGGGLLSYVSNVFGGDAAPSNVDESAKSKVSVMRCLRQAVSTLRLLYTCGRPPSLGPNNSVSDAYDILTSRTKVRARRAFERLHSARSGEVLEALIDTWATEKSDQEQSSSAADDATLEIIDFLVPSAQVVVKYLTESINNRSSVGVPDKGKKVQNNELLSEGVLFAFLEKYLSRLDGPTAQQIWPSYTAFTRDLLSNAPQAKFQLYPGARCFTVAAEKVCQANALEDRKMRREIQDLFLKLVDACVLIAGRSFDQSTWMRRSARDIAKDAEDGGAYTGEKDKPSSEVTAANLIPKMNEFLAGSIMRDFRRFMIDNDKIASISSNMMYYIVAPALKARTRSFEVDPVILELLLEMTKYQVTAKAWRTQVAEVFYDNRFFKASPAASQKWQPLIQALMSQERERFTEIIGKVTAAPSANIFTNRELETMSKALNLRRLTYAVFSGRPNDFLTQFPSLQEMLVDVLRANPPDLVHSQVYLCLRVLLCRFEPRLLSSLWPVILTELMRVFENLMDDLPPDGSNQLRLVLSACKFLDLLLTLQTADFQIHEWMFVTDTVDAVYPPEEWFPQSIMERLAAILEQRKPSGGSVRSSSLAELTSSNGLNFSSIRTNSASADRSPPTPLRRPLLSSVQSVSSIEDLEPFFSFVSISAYESVYANAAVDWAAVEDGLLADIFEGDSNSP